MNLLVVLGLTACAWCLLVAPAPQDPGAGDATHPAARFVVRDVYVDAGARPLGAFQFEYRITGAGARIVSVEGGEHAAFRAAPYYDPAALPRGRILLAAFSTAAALPVGRTRVARLHLHLDAGAEPQFSVVLQACADGEGNVITAQVTESEMEKR